MAAPRAARPWQLTQSNLATVTSQLRRDFSGGPLTLDPQSADWAALTSEPYSLGRFPVLKKLRGIPAKLEVAYRYPLAGHLRLVAGSMPTAPLPVQRSRHGHPGRDHPGDGQRVRA